jgi:hypothetical protein
MIHILTIASVLIAAQVFAQAQEVREVTQEEYQKALAEQLRISTLRHAALDAADRTKITHLKDFLTIYPDSVVRYLSFAGADFPSLSVTTTLHDRYEFRMDVPVKYSDDHLRIVGYGEPECHLMEVASVSPRDDGKGGIELGGTNGGNLQKHFGIKEWGALVESKGDFSVLGYEIEKGKPVPNFNLVIKHLKSLERRIANQKSEREADTGQPATRLEAKSESSDKPQPESEGHSR